MSWLNTIVLTECPLDAPFAPKKKNWAAAVISAVAGLVAGIAGQASTNSANNQAWDMNQANIKAQEDINDKNIALQKETNAQNYKQFQEQNAFNLDMWNKQNEYNKPSEQVQRMLAAGINPAMGYGKTSDASSITSATGAPSVAPQLTAPKNMFQMRPSDWSGISDAGQGAVNAYNQSRMMAAETKNKEALTANTAMDTTMKSKSMQDNLKYLHHVANGSGYQAEFAKQQLALVNATMDYDIQMKYGDMMMQQRSFERFEEELRNAKLNNDILEITKGYANQMSQAQLAQLWTSVHQAKAEIGLINSNKLLTDAQKEFEIQKKTSQIIDNGLKGLDFNIKKNVQDALEQSYRNDANEGMARAYNAWRYGPTGDKRSPSEIFQLDNLPDFMKRQFKNRGYVPKF